jgi:hypothetical protein
MVLADPKFSGIMFSSYNEVFIYFLLVVEVL